MKNRRVHTIVRILCGILLAGSSAKAHEDPAGDIHPAVTGKEGNFAITFKARETPGQYCRMTYAQDGRLIEPRSALDRTPEMGSTGPAGLYGRFMALGSSTVIFEGTSSKKPGYILKSADGTTKQVGLPWPENVELSLFEDAAVTDAGIAITGKEDREILKFYWFPFKEGSKPTILDIGVTECIYHFPVASNPVFAGGKFWVAYVRSGGERVRLHLWSWKPGDKEAYDEILDSPAYSNSHLSLGAIGNRLCLAYHCVDFQSTKNLEARIFTVFREAK